MRKVLIVSPSFAPVNAADMQRVRMSLPFFQQFGWDPVVLAVDPRYVEGVQDPLLLETIPSEIPVIHVKALSTAWTRKFGLGNLGLRAFPFLHREGRKLIRERKIDLVYFSTTVFPAMALGRLWKRETGVPFVLDMQDGWVSDYKQGRKRDELPPKFWFMGRLHGMLEPWTMKAADGLIAVSRGYIDTLHARYPGLREKPAVVLPFGAPEEDFAVLQKSPQANRFFEKADRTGLIHGVYVGRGGLDMAPALRIIFKALRSGLERKAELFGRIRLHFIGTDYAPDDRARETVMPVARECGVEHLVSESPRRVPYFEALQLLADADFLVVPGSDDPDYSASKIFPYILARKPLFCVFGERSNVCETIEKTRGAFLFRFNGVEADARVAEELYRAFAACLLPFPVTPATDWVAFSAYGARESTRLQCEAFDAVLAGAADAKADVPKRATRVRHA